MTIRPGRRTVAAAALSASLLVLTACGSQAPEIPRARQTSTDVPFTGCDKVKCSDTLNGAAYEIKMPTKWNGTLLLYSHGYRYAQPAPPDFSPVETKAVSASDDALACHTHRPWPSLVGVLPLSPSSLLLLSCSPAAGRAPRSRAPAR